MQSLFDSKLAALTAGMGGGCRILAGVSGGVDSIVMAELLRHSSLGVTFAVAHMNFSLRGTESDGDQAFVEEWCRSAGITLYTKKVDTCAFARERGISIEMAARKLRYSWFGELCEEKGYDFVAVAHNLNDSVETMYLNLLRGTGLRGLSGIRESNGRVIRPMLSFRRADIEKYASENRIGFRTDSTNADSSYSRNRIRNDVFPQFREINPAFLETARQEMQRFFRMEEILSEVFKSKEGSLYSHKEGALQIDISLLKQEKCREYWLFRLLEGYGFNSVQIAQIDSNLDAQSGSRLVSATHTALFDRGVIKVYPLEAAPEAGVEWRRYERCPQFDPRLAGAGVLYVDAGKVKQPLEVRAPREGDRFRPLGMKGSKLLSDFFTDMKLDVEQKKRQKVVCDASGAIVCIAGLRIDDRFKITPETREVVEITLS